MVNPSILPQNGAQNISDVAVVSTKVRKPWRSGQYTVYLWEFLWGLLQDTDCYFLIRWTNRAEKEFKMIDVNEIAKLWGTIKNKPRMDDKKLLRALRYYYKTNILRKVKGQRGVYQFLSIPYELREDEEKSNIVAISSSDIVFDINMTDDCFTRVRGESFSSSTSSLSSEETQILDDDEQFYELTKTDNIATTTSMVTLYKSEILKTLV